MTPDQKLYYEYYMRYNTMSVCNGLEMQAIRETAGNDLDMALEMMLLRIGTRSLRPGERIFAPEYVKPGINPSLAKRLRIKKVRALYERAGTPGEKAAAKAALERMLAET